MKRGILYVTAALLLSLAIPPEVWANGPGGRCGGGRGGGGCHGGWGRGGPGCGRFGPRCGFRGGWGGWNGGNVVYGGYGGYGYACGYAGGCGYPYSGYGYGCGTGAAPASYYINYSPTITTGALPAVAPAPGVVAESTSCSVLASGDLVGNVQRALRARGFYNGPIDGQAGAPTRAAIRAYAAKCGLPATGVIDGQLLTSLGLM